MYVCGPTVYDLLHVGNFRGAIFFNLVRHWLERLGYKVNFVYNYTDIDDKIIKRAQEEGCAPLELSQKYIKGFEKDYARLKLAPHEANPRCTEYIGEMVGFIEELVNQGRAYVIDGSVFYSIDLFESYGGLSGKNIDELQAGHRVDPDPRKKNLLDFILWKPSKEGEPSWDSPWGSGRPGWHIECSCMSRILLGDTIDIHGGGLDLIFPHHENEIAQSQGATGHPLARYWMHNNFIHFGKEKMSKSQGNIVKGRDFMDRYHPEVLKYMILSVHYRSILNLDKIQIDQAIAGITRIYSALAVAGQIGFDGVSDEVFVHKLAESDRMIEEALNDDFNTPAMFAAIFDVVRTFNASYEKGKQPDLYVKGRAKVFCEWLKKYGNVMSLFQEPPVEFLRRLDLILMEDKNITAGEIEAMLEERNRAREARDFKKADDIRNKLSNLGILVQDSSEGTSWEVKKG